MSSVSILTIADLDPSNISTTLAGQDHDLDASFIFVDAAPGRGPRLHKHAYPEVFIVTEGEVTLRTDQGEQVATAGQMVIVPGGVPHAFHNSGEGQLRQIDIHLNARFETEWLE
jgi:mannose-6-phosphate isomerase-like protein (cupin superfamily)